MATSNGEAAYSWCLDSGLREVNGVFRKRGEMAVKPCQINAVHCPSIITASLGGALLYDVH